MRNPLDHPTTAEAVCFPSAAQAARVHRPDDGRQPETVALLTSAPPQELDAQNWLRSIGLGFGGIENGLHQRLDASYDDDLCRVRNPNGMQVLGIFRRLANSLFMEWRSRQTKPQFLDHQRFRCGMAAEGHRRAMILVDGHEPFLHQSPMSRSTRE